jgi:hypothetical protein
MINAQQDKSLYQQVVEAEVEHDHHESDLYVEDTEVSRAILSQFPVSRRFSSGFTDQVTGKPWIDIPFAYEPFWKEKWAA